MLICPFQNRYNISDRPRKIADQPPVSPVAMELHIYAGIHMRRVHTGRPVSPEDSFDPPLSGQLRSPTCFRNAGDTDQFMPIDMLVPVQDPPHSIYQVVKAVPVVVCLLKPVIFFQPLKKGGNVRSQIHRNIIEPPCITQAAGLPQYFFIILQVQRGRASS